MSHLLARHLLAAGFCLLPLHVLHAQPAVKCTPLHTFFQQNYDSAIIYHSGSSWNNSPNYLILAKQQGHLYFFTYTSPYRGTTGKYYPGRLPRTFAAQDQVFRATAPDTNRYLLPQPLRPATLRRAWQELRPGQLWRVQDDQQALANSSACVVEDADDNVFYLIDRQTIRVASFYAPDFLEQCLGKDPGRQQAIKARTILQALTRPE